jgi:hypothetical protein
MYRFADRLDQSRLYALFAVCVVLISGEPAGVWLRALFTGLPNKIWPALRERSFVRSGCHLPRPAPRLHHLSPHVTRPILEPNSFAPQSSAALENANSLALVSAANLERYPNQVRRSPKRWVWVSHRLTCLSPARPLPFQFQKFRHQLLMVR